MKHQFDAYEREYIADRGWRIDNDGLLVLTAEQARKYTGHSLFEPNTRTLTVPSIHGLCLLFEGQHFRVDNQSGTR